MPRSKKLRPLPCPFCGENPEIVKWSGKKRTIRCLCCAAPAVTEASLLEAVKAWNSCGTQEIVDELKKVVDRHQKAAYLTCAETCWCLDVERVILRLEKEKHETDTQKTQQKGPR